MPCHAPMCLTWFVVLKKFFPCFFFRSLAADIFVIVLLQPFSLACITFFFSCVHYCTFAAPSSWSVDVLLLSRYFLRVRKKKTLKINQCISNSNSFIIKRRRKSNIKDMRQRKKEKKKHDTFMIFNSHIFFLRLCYANANVEIHLVVNEREKSDLTGRRYAFAIFLQMHTFA